MIFLLLAFTKLNGNWYVVSILEEQYSKQTIFLTLTLPEVINM